MKKIPFTIKDEAKSEALKKNNKIKKIIASSATINKIERDNTMATIIDNVPVMVEGYCSRAITAGNNANAIASGVNSRATTAGDGANAITTGIDAHATTAGNYTIAKTNNSYSHAIATGNCSCAITNDDYSHAIVAGSSSKAMTSGNNSIACGIGVYSRVKGKLGSWLVVAEWSKYIPNQGNQLLGIVSAKVDGDKIKPNTWYKAKDGQLIEDYLTI